MAQITFKYNPSQQSVEELEQTFVGRQQLLEGILSELKEQPKGSSRQHYVIIGPRGIGKTNLLLMIHYAINERSDLAGQWIPVQLAEESYSVLSLADFLLETLKALSADVDGLKEEIRAISASNDDQTVIDRSMDLLHKIADAHNKGIIVLVDNLDMILQVQMRDQMEIHRLRSMLMTQDFITIIGTSPTLFNELTNYDSPLYNFFKTINLKELSIEEMEELIAKHLTMEGKHDQVESIAQYRPRLQAIRHLTGGNPRLLLMLYQICEHGAIPEVKQALETLLDELTPYFKHRMELLAPQMRKVLDTLAKSDNALTPTEIAREARIDVKQINVQLARMKDEGLITATPLRGKRNTYYSITERLFRIWYKMRLSRKDKIEVYYLAEFIEAWYQAEEMLDLIMGLGERFNEVLANGDQYGAQHLLESVQIVGQASKDSSTKAVAITQESEMLMHLGKASEAADKLEELEDFIESNSLVELMRILVLYRMSAGQWSMALQCAEKAFTAEEEPGKDQSRRFWTFNKAYSGNFHLSKGVDALFNTTGQILGELHRDMVAVSTILHDAGALLDTWLCLGWWLCVSGKFLDASNAYQIAEEKAIIIGDKELARMIEMPRTASRVIAERIEKADNPVLYSAAWDLPDLSQESEIWLVVIKIIRMWLGVDFAVHGLEGCSRVPNVTEVNSPLDAFLRGITDLVALKNAENAQQVATQLGNERREITEHLNEFIVSGKAVFFSIATVLGLRERDHKKAKEQVTITIKRARNLMDHRKSDGNPGL